MTRPDRIDRDAPPREDDAADADAPIAYLERVRTWYLALGYPTPYRWARHVDVPFARLRVPLAEARIALVTTAAPRRPGAADASATGAYRADAKFFAVYSGATGDGDPDLRIDHVAIDTVHTSGADLGSFFPLAALRRAAAAGRIGALAPRFHGVPTNRSQSRTREVDAPEVAARCRDDGADAAILVANCPVCHQTMAIVAAALEASGIASVVLGCAKDIVEHVGVPRFVFSDFPLGNAAGRPHDVASQDRTLALALDLLESAPGPRTTVRSPLRWSDRGDWKDDYCNAARLSAEELARRRAEFDAAKTQARAGREARS